MKWFTALLLLALAPIVQAADPAPIGRIFFTPEQRAQLDLLRSQKAVALQVRDEPIPENVTYSGIVRSSDGKTTVWVNNEVLTDAALRLKQSIVGRVDRNGRILLQTQATGATQLQLKVGQTAELFSGKVDESFTQRKVTPPKPGAAEIDKASPPKQAQPPGPQNTNKPLDAEENRQAAPKS